MIISHKFKFIFIKTTKTAGTSIEVALNRFLGPTDIATAIYPAEPDHTPKNFLVGKSSESSYELRNHMGISQLKGVIDDEIISSYFKFCVEREPVDKCISHYCMQKNSAYHNKGNENLTWDDYVERGIFPVDNRKYADSNGVLLVDSILRYEDLDNQLKDILSKLGVGEFQLWPKAKRGYRQGVNYTASDVEQIYERFGESLSLTPYDKPTPF
jgi:hypothetical protein